MNQGKSRNIAFGGPTIMNWDAWHPQESPSAYLEVQFQL